MRRSSWWWDLSTVSPLVRKPPDRFALSAIPSCSLSSAQAGVWHACTEVRRTWPRARAGAERLLRHLHSHGVPIALATSSHQRHYAVKTQRHAELFSLFSHRITGARVATRSRSCDPQCI